MDIRKIFPLTYYTPNTAYTYEGDNKPLIDVDLRGDFYQSILSDCGHFYQGWYDAEPTLGDYSLVKYNLSTYEITLIASEADLELSGYEVPAIIVPLFVDYETPDVNYYSSDDGHNYYYCLINSTSTSVPLVDLIDFTVVDSGKRESIDEIQPGDVLYYIYDNVSAYKFAVYAPSYYPSNSVKKLYYTNVRSTDVPVAVGVFTTSAYLIDSVDQYAEIKFGGIVGKSFGMDVPTQTKEITDHTDLVDIAAQDTSDPETWSTYYDEFPDWSTYFPDQISHGHYAFVPTIKCIVEDKPVDQSWWTDWSVSLPLSYWYGKAFEIKYVNESFGWVVAPSVCTAQSALIGLCVKISEITVGGVDKLALFIACGGVWNETILDEIVQTEIADNRDRSLFLYDVGSSETPGSVSFKPFAFSEANVARSVGFRINSDELMVCPTIDFKSFLNDLYTQSDNFLPGINVPLISSKNSQNSDWVDDVIDSVSYDLSDTGTEKYTASSYTEKDVTDISNKIKKCVSNMSLQVQPMFANKATIGATDLADEYNFLLTTYNGTKQINRKDYNVYPGASPVHLWSRYESDSGTAGVMSKIEYDYQNKILTMVGDVPFNTYEGYKYGGDTRDLLHKSDNIFLDSNGNPYYKVGLPTVGCMMLVNYNKDTYSYSSGMMFSYENFSGYGTNTLVFYNVELLHKLKYNTVKSIYEFQDLNWVGSNPGIYAEEYYNPISPLYQSYNDLHVPLFPSTTQYYWQYATSSIWYFRLLPVSFLRLKIIGGGSFSQLAINNIVVNAGGTDVTVDFDTLRNGVLPELYYNSTDSQYTLLHNDYVLRSPQQDDDGTDVPSFDVLDSFALDPKTGNPYQYSSFFPLDTKEPPSSGLPNSDGLEELANTLSGGDFVNTSFYTRFRMGYILGGPSQVPKTASSFSILGFPEFPASATNFTVYLPSVLFMNHKEMWIDSSLLTQNLAIQFSVSDLKIGSNFTDAVAKDTCVELCIAQSGINDNEDYKLSLDKVLVGKKLFVDLIEGDKIRFFVKSRI